VAVEHARARAKAAIQGLQRPFAWAFRRAGVPADAVTWLGLALTLVAAALILADQLLAAGLVAFFAGGADVLDGTLARERGASAFGAFLDSTLDRVGEGALFAALVVLFAMEGQPWAAGLAALASLAGQLVSYTRARAEGLGASCTVGLATRGERLVLLVLGLVTGWLLPALVLIAGLSAVTAAQRVRAVAQALRAQP
jgi:CDP-diacylglycerol--glycerol-3-phosphate 3-phosphatidyltransferase